MLTEYNTTILVCNCDSCHKLLYEGDNIFTFKETNNTIISPIFCDDICLHTTIKKHPFLEDFKSIMTKLKNTNYNNYYTNMFKFLLCDKYYWKIIGYNCSFNSIKILHYINNILKKKNKTIWEKTFLKNSLSHNLIKIEKKI